MTESGRVIVKLWGGPLDGDSFVLSANGSIEVPTQFSYLGAAKDEATWMVYECENAFAVTWPAEDEERKYHFIGQYSLNRARLVKAT